MRDFVVKLTIRMLTIFPSLTQSCASWFLLFLASCIALDRYISSKLLHNLKYLKEKEIVKENILHNKQRRWRKTVKGSSFSTSTLYFVLQLEEIFAEKLLDPLQFAKSERKNRKTEKTENYWRDVCKKKMQIKYYQNGFQDLLLM